MTTEIQKSEPQSIGMDMTIVSQLVQLAQAKPRNVEMAKANAIKMATMDDETAQSCYYTLKRRNKDGSENVIQGPSIRCAEIVKATWGNIVTGRKVLGHDGKTITGQAYCIDLENLVFHQVESKRRITTRQGNTYGDDMITVTGNAASSIAHREAVFGVIPRAIIQEVYNAAKERAQGDVQGVDQRWTDAKKKFAALGVQDWQLLRWMNHESGRDITPEDIGNLVGLYNALNEEHTTIDKEFGEMIKEPEEAKTEVDPPESKEKNKPKSALKPVTL